MIKKMLMVGFVACFGILSVNAGEKIACIGDSITFGYKIKKRNNFSYPAQLAKMLGSKYEVKNFGVSGRTLLRKGNAPYWKTGKYKQVLQWNPNIVIIKLGTNDTKMNNWKFKDDFEKDLTDLANSFRELKSKPEVYLALPVPAFLDGDKIDRKRVSDGVIPIIKKVAKDQNFKIIDFYSLMEDKKTMFPDSIHPSAEGAFELSAEVYKTIIGNKYPKTFKELSGEINDGATSKKGNNVDKIAKKTSKWHGFSIDKFKNNGVKCMVVSPDKPAEGKPWVWRARFWGHQPQTDIALLKRGYHIAYCDVGNLLGAPEAVKRWDDFYKYATEKLGLSKKPALEGMSRGGLIIFNWAAANPDKVSCIYGDAPVCDLKSWPGGKGTGKGSEGVWKTTLKVYGFKNEQEALEYTKNPVDHATTIAKANIPVLIVYGKADDVVPPAENCLIFEDNFKKAGGDIILIGKDKCGHHPHSLKDPKKIVDFILKNTSIK